MNRLICKTLSLSLSLLPFCLLSANAAGPQPTTMMTYNIRYLNNSDGEDVWSNRREKVVETIRQADVVGLQEVVLQQLQFIQAQTPGWTWYGVGRTDGIQDGESVPIGYRDDRFESLAQGTRWLSETPDVAGSRGWDALLPRTVTWMRLKDKSTGQSFLVINTHFDHRGELARERSGALIAKLVDELGDSETDQDPAVLVMGDFNAGPDSTAVKNALSGDQVPLRNARDISKQAASGPTGTWNGFKAIAPKTRIDHILVSDRVQVHTYQVLNPKTAAGRFASDHLPVAVSVSIE